MRKQFFLKNLMLFLVPLLIPTIVLGSLAVTFTNRYVEGEIERNNGMLFQQIDRAMETVMNEMTSLSVAFATPELLYSLEEILRTQTLTLDHLRLMKSTIQYINAPVNARPYIESIYVYVYNDHGQFLASGTGLAKFDQFHDVAWRDSFERNRAETGIWTESRLIRRYSFEEPIRVTTVYKNLYSSVHHRPYGVLVLNVYNEYIEKQLRNMELYDEHTILVLDPHGRLLFRNREGAIVPEAQTAAFASGTAAFRLTSNGRSYAVDRMTSAPFGWRYVSVAPEEELRQVPSRLSRYTLLLIVVSFAVGVALTFLLTRSNVNRIRKMISIIKSAERGQPLPETAPLRTNNEYDFITQKIIMNFIEQNYLKIQLSEKKYKLQAAEWTALQAQINPHFLFNTLETIYWKVLALTGKPNEANRMLEHLSDLLKYSLDRPNRIVPLEKEIRHTMNYVHIQTARYKDKFDVVWDYDPDDCVYGVPKLLLQPLVENAIYHGIKEKDGPCALKVKVSRLPEGLRIAVIDNGVGMTAERLAEVRDMLRADGEPGGHIGIVNTDKRIKLLYGEAYGIRIQSKRGRGTVVSLLVPV
ncbi:sensor histidine kinase [Paenibacillus sp.]|uniref:sensor histidine kinase n=1 Tax=Paenibacillus sp. TaxID=58172 RepID=UPI002D4C79B1|nr:sensor histidine kinase [Paenibacillus sp.]HZG83686.1 sensor histidine kinase [Paenibacillus sp.]